ncbi:hypothetical protein SDC9_85446 [bioreactor metagenome]|uniref:Uncharacterized protein n=1 Tax=bioreactor metagenome TaxID=1076179 RepID=A0A644ZD73_9ZZZZ
MSMAFDPGCLPGLLDFDEAHLRKNRERQCACWRGEKLSVPVLFIVGELTERQRMIPEYDFKEAFADAAKMLCREARGAGAIANGGGDGVPSIRANLGTGILLACFGMEQAVFPDKMPWLTEHLSKAQISSLTPDDIRPRGSFARGLAMMRYFKEVMGDAMPVYVMDTQGPFDLAHLMLGDELFIQLYDDPPFVHHLLNLCLELGKKTHRWMKEVIGEPLNALHHGQMYSNSFGIRICEDTTVLLNPDHIEEFAMSYSRRLAGEFGGAWVHYCGYHEYLTDAILASPEFKVLNFGLIPGHEHEIDFYKNMEKFTQAGKVNYNFWPRFPGESSQEYIARQHEFAAAGVLAPIFPHGEMAMNATDLLGLWQRLSQ